MAGGAAVDRSLVWKAAVAVALVALLAALGWVGSGPQEEGGRSGDPPAAAASWGAGSFDYSSVPDYDGDVSVAVNGGIPFFDEEDFSRGDVVELAEIEAEYETDGAYGRAGPAFVTVGPATVTDEKRGPLRLAKQPSGWAQAKYPGLSEGGFLYNRCHLVAWSLSGSVVALGEPRNLMTGTRYLNVKGMLGVEERVGCYVRRTGNRVLYRVTPVFEGDELLARGVLMEAASVEDRGREGSLLVCEWCYNVQPGVEIDYATGGSSAAG